MDCAAIPQDHRRFICALDLVVLVSRDKSLPVEFKQGGLAYLCLSLHNIIVTAAVLWSGESYYKDQIGCARLHHGQSHCHAVIHLWKSVHYRHTASCHGISTTAKAGYVVVWHWLSGVSAGGSYQAPHIATCAGTVLKRCRTRVVCPVEWRQTRRLNDKR